MIFEEISRPARNRRRLGDSTLDYDADVEAALRKTLHTGKACVIPLTTFHSSPAKGRLWAEGYAVRHRVLPTRLHVAAWLEEGRKPNGVHSEV